VTTLTRDLDSLEQAKATLVDLAIRFGPKLLVAALIMVGGVIVARWSGRAVTRALHRLELEPPVRMLLTRLARVFVLMMFAILALQNLGVELLPLIAGLGVAGAGIALAMQGVLSNVVAGLTIIFTKPYRVGEYIAIVGVEGQVDSISMFSTTLLHADRSRVVVPNRKIVGEILHNYGRIRQAELQVGIAYDADLPRALAAITEVVRANPAVLADPAPLVGVASLGDSAIQVAIRPWVAASDFGSIGGALHVAIVERLRRERIAIPFPQREVRLLTTGGAAA
jgi:small conductance mechanosensitive channel